MFTSFRARLLSFLLALLIPVLGGIFYYVNRNNNEYTEETINRYLQLGADVFDYTRQQQALTLQAITNSLTWDFGFRTAYAANDPGTLFDASLNVLDRSMSSVDMLMIVSLDHEVVIDTELQGFEQLSGSFAELLEAAEENDELTSQTLASVNGVPFQLIALPLYLPRQVAWIIGGFALDEAFVNRVKQTILSEVSVVRVQPGTSVEVIASTLSQPDQEALARQVQVDSNAQRTLQRVRLGNDENVEEWSTLLRPLFAVDGEATRVLAVIQRSYQDNRVNVVQFRRLLIQFYSVVLVLSLLAVLMLARSISKPLTRLAGVVGRIAEGDYRMRAPVTSRDELGGLASSVNDMAEGLAEKEKVRDLLGKVVSQQIAEELLRNPVELGGEERIVTVLFSDIQGFTSYCEGLPPKTVLEELNHVLSTISDLIETHHGVVDKYQGDAVMALFGAPVTDPDDAVNAMQAGLDIIATISKMSTALSACVGINTGLVVAGNLGSQNRLNYSVIGDTVNLAARLESLTRLYHVKSIVSADSVRAAPGFVYRELDEVQVAGKRQAVKIYELVARQAEVSAEKRAELDGYAEALDAYRQRDWSRARQMFSQLQGSCDNTQLCQVFLDRILYFETNPPADDWCGIYTFDTK